jgi:purine-binding chemotaxis protein CheW
MSDLQSLSTPGPSPALRGGADARSIEPGGTRQLATFVLNGLRFGVGVLDVQEVLRFHRMTPVPRAPQVVRGLINLRGQIVTAIDMRRQLGFPERPDGRQPMNMVVRTPEGVVSLLVDEIGDVMTVEDDQLEPPPDTVKGRAREMVTGVYKLDRQLLLLLDLDRAVSTAPAGQGQQRA